MIRDSVFDRNGAGILPNTYANEALPPGERTTIVRNRVTGSGRARVSIRTALAGFVGIGIAIAGGNDNVLRGNRVSRSERYGIAVFPTARYVSFNPSMPEPGPPWRPHGNRVVGKDGKAGLWPSQSLRGAVSEASVRPPRAGRRRPACPPPCPTR